MLIPLLDYSSTLKMEAICSSEPTVNFQQTTRCYFPEDRELFNTKPSLCHFCVTASTPDPLPRKAFQLFISFHGVSNVH
jgi:hypothetical protein